MWQGLVSNIGFKPARNHQPESSPCIPEDASPQQLTPCQVKDKMAPERAVNGRLSQVGEPPIEDVI